MNVVRWNEDKPHRCPGCHTVVVYSRRPRSWILYRCCKCKQRFARFARLGRLLPRQPRTCNCDS